MILSSTALDGVFVVDVERLSDERGFFARTYCVDELRDRGLELPIVQSSISFNVAAGTLRGMHYQRAPFAETKLVRCTRGAIFDVIIDLRPDSPTHRAWVGCELTAENRRMLYIPEGCAHGFLTLTDNCEVSYQISERYHPEAAAGVRWDDPAFGVIWPARPSVISARDAAYGDYDADSTH
jgi:dTDP-4-dehydrorhamnose 3,5-epimerase